jgi:hypothetical protein
MAFTDPNVAGPQYPDYTARQRALEQRRALQRAQMIDAMRMQMPEGQMVSGRYVAPHWSENLNVAIQPSIAALQGHANEAAERSLNDEIRAAAAKHMAAMPTAQQVELQGPSPDGISPVTGTVQPTREDKIRWAQAGMNIPTLRDSLTNAFEDQLINEPVREEQRQARKDEKDADRELRREALQNNLRLLQEKLEDRALDRASREQIAKQARDLQLQIAQLGNATRRDIAGAQDATKRDLAAAAREAAAAKVTGPKLQDAKDVIELLSDAEKLIPTGTSSGVGTVRDAVLSAVGMSTGAGDAAAQLKTIGGLLTSKMPKMSGPQSDKDVALYKEMAGKLGDPTVPVSQKLAALKTIREINQRYLDANAYPGTNDRTGGGKIKQYNPATGRLE